ncbi:putative defense protein Hdd11 [Oncorhynchus nerka]|uniref:putative defense protein Hdd11 n=1 Tax=Oncorhynchus nerka TaxID=8023 RepID=UPI001131651B|nr:putative defense protein Hdd11 [Oncorhynchus nerka]
MELLMFSLVLLQGISPCFSFPNGAPTSACDDMVPRHTGVQPQPTPAPYTILTSTKTLQTGQPITVTITGTNYRGVLLEARSAASTSTNALGSWQLPPPDTKFLQCSGNKEGAITHANTNVKDDTTVFTWLPPNNTNTIYFMATVAQQRTVYWLNIRSGTLIKGSEGIGLATGGNPGMASKGFLLLLAPCMLVSQMLPR